MKIVALLAWFEEKPESLERMIASIAPVCSAVVALDGAYADFPGGRPVSQAEQAHRIRLATRRNDMGLLLLEPEATWAGQEIEKRTDLFRAGELMTTPDDWYLVIDGDEELAEYPADLLDQLAATDRGAALVRVTEPGQAAQPFHRLLRAQRGLHVEGRHYRYVTAEGVEMNGDSPAPALDLSQDVLLLHHRRERTRDRAAAADAWGNLLRDGVHG